MIEALALGAVIGLFSGVVPGPYSALIAAAALEAGFWAAFRLAVLPLVTESALLTICALVLTRLPRTLLRWTGILGGALLFYLSLETWRASASRPAAMDGSVRSDRRRVVEGMLLAVFSPAPWVFWLLVGAPLFLRSWRQGWGAALGFLGAFLGCLVAVHLTLAGVASYGRRTLSGPWRSRLVRATSVALLIGGIVLVWQSAIGNFSRLVQGTGSLPGVVVDSLGDGR